MLDSVFILNGIIIFKQWLTKQRCSSNPLRNSEADPQGISLLRWTKDITKALNKSYIISGVSIFKKIGETNNLLKHLIVNSQSNSNLFDGSQKITIQIKDEIGEIGADINDLKNSYQSKIADSMNTEDEDKNWDGILQILNLRLASLSQRFKDYLTIRSKVIEKQEERKSKLNFVDEKNKISNRRISSFKNYSRKRTNGTSTQEMDIEEEGLINENNQGAKNKFEQIEMIENRSKNLENIKQVLGDINQIFVKFSEIVNAQQLMVERIDSDTEMALLNVEKGRKELSEHYQNVSSYRNLLFKVFLILIVFATLYIIFVV